MQKNFVIPYKTGNPQEVEFRYFYRCNEILKVGDRCKVKLSAMEQIVNTAYIQEIYPDKNECIVHVVELACKYTVPFDSITPISQQQVRPYSRQGHTNTRNGLYGAPGVRMSGYFEHTTDPVAAGTGVGGNLNCYWMPSFTQIYAPSAMNVWAQAQEVTNDISFPPKYFNANKSTDIYGRDLPTDMDTLRYFYNLGIHYYNNMIYNEIGGNNGIIYGLMPPHCQEQRNERPPQEFYATTGEFPLMNYHQSK